MESKIHVIDFKSRKGEKVFYYYLILLFKILLAVNRLNWSSHQLKKHKMTHNYDRILL